MMWILRRFKEIQSYRSTLLQWFAGIGVGTTDGCYYREGTTFY